MMIGKIIKSLTKQLIATAIVIAISIAIMSVNQAAGIILMMLYSSWMVIKSANKEMPLNKFTALLPGIMSLAIFFIMLGLIGVHDEEMPLVGLGLGIIPGWLMARGHNVYKKDGILYAKRTFFYVFIWALSLLFTQGATLLGMRKITDFGFLLNGFSTAMMVVLSMVLLKKTIYKQSFLKKKKHIFSFVIVPILLSTFTQPVEATVFSAKNDVELVDKVGKYIFTKELLSPLYNICKVAKIECRMREYSHKDSGTALYQLSIPLPNGPVVNFDLRDASIRSKNQFSSDCSNSKDLEYKESKFKGYLVQTCRAKPESSRYYYASMLWYEKWILHAKMWDYKNLPGKWQHEDAEKYYLFAIGNIIKKLLTIEIQESLQTNSPPLPVSPSQESSSFSDVIAELSSDKNLESISYDNWSKNNKQNSSTQDQANNDSYPQQAHDSDSEFSDDELAAGAIAALLMLLASLGMNAATTVAQGAASSMPVTDKDVVDDSSDIDNNDNNWGYDSRPHSNGTLMLDGAEAEQWMKDKNNGYLDENGNPTKKFQEFMNSTPSDKGTGLQGFAGDTDVDGNPVGDYVILVDDENTQIPKDNDDSSNEPEKSKNDKTTKTDDSKSGDGDTLNETESNNNTTTTYTDNSDDSNDTDTDDKKTSDDSQQNNTTKDTKDTKPETPKGEVPPIDYSNVREDLENFMSDIVKDKTDEGYYVRNPHRFEKIKDMIPDYAPIPIETILTLAEWIEKGFNNLGKIHGHGVDNLFGWKGGQCGDYAQNGINWSRDKIKELYGENVKLDKIIIKSNVSPDYINHAATRITLPNGDKYVLDYWEGIQNKEKRIYTEDEWIKRHSEKLNTLSLGTKTEYEASTASVDTVNTSINNANRTNELLLQKYIDSKGEDEGKKAFLDYITKKKSGLKEAKTLVSKWRPKP